MISRDDFYKITNSKQHSEFERSLKELLFNKPKREEFYHNLLAIDHDVSVDSFRSYFEDYAAERKSNMQDYTPESISKMLSMISRSDANDTSWSAYDPTAGTGSLLIQKWWDDMTQESPWTYAPHNYFYFANELADNVIPYLLHNLALRGMNAIVVHGDTLEGTAKQAYFVQNADDDFLHFSSINVLPHTEAIAEYLGITKWEEEAIDHIEDALEDVKFSPVYPMQRKALEINPESTASEPQFSLPSDYLRLKDIADIERAKSKKVYPVGTIVIQMSATRGQIGLLKSSGEVGSQYACVNPIIGNERFIFYMLKLKAPRWFHRVQEGLNLKLQDIEDIPVALPM